MDVTSQKKNENFGTEISYTVTGKIAERHEFKNNMDKGQKNHNGNQTAQTFKLC